MEIENLWNGAIIKWIISTRMLKYKNVKFCIAEAIPRRKFVSLNVYVREEDRLKNQWCKHLSQEFGKITAN